MGFKPVVNEMDVDFEENDDLRVKNAIILAPKLEYQYELGAATITKSECIRQWTDSVIRPDSRLCRG